MQGVEGGGRGEGLLLAVRQTLVVNCHAAAYSRTTSMPILASSHVSGRSRKKEYNFI